MVHILRSRREELSTDEYSRDKHEVIFFFDLEISGHHVEYLYHLIKYRIAHTECPPFVLLTHPGFIKRIVEFNLPGDWENKGIKVINPSREEMERVRASRSFFSRATEKFSILYNYVVKYNVKCCHLLTINEFQFVLGRYDSRSIPCAIRGILFSPFSTIDKGGDFSTHWRSAKTRFRKHLQMLWMLRNKKIEHIYILNDSVLVKYLNKRYHRKNLFIMLPDPILIPPRKIYNPLRDVSRNLSKRIRFLLFGSLSSRKGIFLVLDALRSLPETIDNRVEVIFAGKVVAEDSERFRSAVNNTQRDKPRIKILFKDEFIPFEEIATLFSGVDCVLLPYTLVGASSGIIGHSALYGKPVIGPGKGIIGQLIRNYGLGLDIMPVNASNIASAIASFVEDGPISINKTGMRRFVEEHQPSYFVETLINS